MDLPDRAFIAAWNELVINRNRYEPEWQRSMSSAGETGIIDAMPYKLMLKVLDHIEVGADGQLTVIFFAGTRIETDVNNFTA